MINKKYYSDRADAAIAFANWLHLNYTPKYDFEWNYNWNTLKQGYIRRTTTDQLYQIWETLDVNESLRRE